MEIDSNNNIEIVKTDEFVNESLFIGTADEDNEKLTLESLNFGSFLMILDHLDSNSLMELCQVNDHFRNKVFVYKHILSKKLFEIDEFVDVSLILKKNKHFLLHGLLFVFFRFANVKTIHSMKKINYSCCY